MLSSGSMIVRRDPDSRPSSILNSSVTLRMILWKASQETSVPRPAVDFPRLCFDCELPSAAFSFTLPPDPGGEIGGLFHNGITACHLVVCLEALDHAQQPVPLKTDNSTGAKFANRNIKNRLTKHMDMRYHWIQDRSDPGLTKVSSLYIGRQEQRTWLIILQSTIIQSFTDAHDFELVYVYRLIRSKLRFATDSQATHFSLGHWSASGIIPIGLVYPWY